MKRLKILCLALLVYLLLGGTLRAQSANQKYSNTGPTIIETESTRDYTTAVKMARWANEERQKQLVKDTARLVELTREFKEHMATAGDTRPSEADLKLITQIEKLAHTVREEMANAGAAPQPPRPQPNW